MKVQVLFFASLREALGTAGETLEVGEGCDVAAARALLAARRGEWQRLASPRIRAAVNQALVAEAHGLAEGDELAFFPPVTGG
ncbi:molybdopterin converting factor subunit 1 [Viridibacterium curvum]|uniref:Molybdopterin synthase sulfur carrier subunit n=1 Tax=Viridibacterium curvum TaxID=1101404 RepID=A0ABP9QAR1_9RHOO